MKVCECVSGWIGGWVKPVHTYTWRVLYAYFLPYTHPLTSWLLLSLVLRAHSSRFPLLRCESHRVLFLKLCNSNCFTLRWFRLVNSHVEQYFLLLNDYQVSRQELADRIFSHPRNQSTIFLFNFYMNNDNKDRKSFQGLQLISN